MVFLLLLHLHHQGTPLESVCFPPMVDGQFYVKLSCDKEAKCNREVRCERPRDRSRIRLSLLMPALDSGPTMHTGRHCWLEVESIVVPMLKVKA